ncbi:TerB family tellurite resistance protein [Pedobacter sp. MC2016-15]|uniref:TerB family tellurite resistance protein n=1 Tax=Pedobacter sp. MC2016-15 TaxID=2994473 RepID=UPI002245F8AA|nr:TerB family tellurite resistance protein [Pedobacter sp. MC2016-15]MCX2479350.1 TerB family tellurite resistance protein [Pedobacter sp. MC2016-15]
MKTLFLIILLFSSIQISFAQTQEVEQLLLNVEKLSQLKGILSNMKTGYQLVSNGYNSVKNIAQGNFTLHEVFLDGLMKVSPEVKKYHRVADIISYQSKLVVEYKAALKRYNRDGNFSADELNYLGKVYNELFKQSLNDLDQLLMVITSSKLRMTDDERLSAIDRIFGDSENKLVFLRSFNRHADVLNLQKHQSKLEDANQKQFYNLK